MTDAILNSKISLAKAKHIPVVADAHVPVALKTSEMDLCIIIGNLFDNAIEESLQLPEEKRMNPHLHGYEKYPALHVVHQFNARKQKKSVADFTPQKDRDTDSGLFVSMILWSVMVAI